MNGIEWMKDAVRRLNEASEAYYSTGTEVMSDREYDRLYAQLEEAEAGTGTVLSGSPTQRVGYAPVQELPKEAHKAPVLSLDKTKDISRLCQFLGNREGILSWKLDGLTVVLTYQGGRLIKAVTRGDGAVGEVITDNARCFMDVPLAIPYAGPLTVRGEALITYTDFEQINRDLPEGVQAYKNPRNLCAGSVRQLDPGETRRRKVRFQAFAVSGEGLGCTARSGQLDRLSSLGFGVVEHVTVSGPGELEAQVKSFASRIKDNPFPSDGLVLQFNDIAYGESLGATAKFPKDSMAFKWEDETKETTLRKIQWNTSRTGLINPVAIFDPVELEGTTVSRASLHNVSIVKELAVTPGDTISVYKANMIIPQVAGNLTGKGAPEIPCTCPVCGAPAGIQAKIGAETLWCTNPGCPARHIKAFAHAASRDALNIEGLSEETIRKLMDEGLITCLPDLFRLGRHKGVITQMEGFGEKSFQKLEAGINKARRTSLDRVLCALGILNIGHTASRAVCAHFKYDPARVASASIEELTQVEGLGSVTAEAFTEWFREPHNRDIFSQLLSELELLRPETPSGSPLTGMSFVITGSLGSFKNRDELKALIEGLGGKVSGGVSAKTTYLINNNAASASGKNRKAKELGIPIIPEQAFLEMIK